MKIGDRVLISPQVTHSTDWREATVVEVEENPFVGIVITAETDDADLFFEKEDMFRIAERGEKCTP